jgi:predicted DNA binding CopG/RHH family protein
MNKLPVFKTETEEQEFWQKHDSTDYVDWSKAKLVEFPNLKPSTKIISLRLPEGLLNDLKAIANQYDIPYQSLMKILLIEKMREIKTKHQNKQGS